MNDSSSFAMAEVLAAAAGIFSGIQGHFLVTIDWEGLLSYGLNVAVATTVPLMIRILYSAFRKKGGDQ